MNWSGLSYPLWTLTSGLQVRSEFSLKTHSKLDTMVTNINDIVPLAQGTMTGLAIKYVMNAAFIAEEGDRPKVPIVSRKIQTCYFTRNSVSIDLLRIKTTFYFLPLDGCLSDIQAKAGDVTYKS